MNADGTETMGEAFQAIISPVSAILDPRLLWAIVSQIIIAGILGFVIHLLIGWTWLAYITGATIWTIILCFTPAVNLWFIKPLGNHAVVLEHALRKKEIVTLAKATKLQKTRVYRVIFGPTLTGKSPFETILNNKAINLQRSIGLEEKEIKVSTKDGANHSIKFWTACTPIQTHDCLINLARHTEAAVVEYFRRSFVGYLQRVISEIPNTDDLLVALSIDNQGRPTGHIVKGFNELFGGKDAVHVEEEERGIFTGDPKCEIEIDPKFRKVRQALPTAILKRNAIKALVDGAGGIHPDMAANMVAADLGDELPGKVSKFIIEVPPGTGTRDINLVVDSRQNNRP